MSLTDRLLVSALPFVPRALVGLVARRYVAGATAADAFAGVQQLMAEGACATLDILGESVADDERAARFTSAYQQLFPEIRALGLDSTVSVKLSMLGLTLDKTLARENFIAVAQSAHAERVPVSIDMEDHTTTDATLAIYREARSQLDGVGAVLQAYLRRTLDDIAALPAVSQPCAVADCAAALAIGPPHIRLCKGIYVEPAAVAYQGHQEVRDNYLRCLRALLDRGAYVGIATHDAWLLDRAEAEVRERGLTPNQYEFQMLLGVTPARRRQLIAAGHRLRVYVPFGEEWYAYSLRRLRENPSIARHVLKALLGLR